MNARGRPACRNQVEETIYVGISERSMTLPHPNAFQRRLRSLNLHLDRELQHRSPRSDPFPNRQTMHMEQTKLPQLDRRNHIQVKAALGQASLLFGQILVNPIPPKTKVKGRGSLGKTKMVIGKVMAPAHLQVPHLNEARVSAGSFVHFTTRIQRPLGSLRSGNRACRMDLKKYRIFANICKKSTVLTVQRIVATLDQMLQNTKIHELESGALNVKGIAIQTASASTIPSMTAQRVLLP